MAVHPENLSFAELEEHVKNVVEGAANTEAAARRLKTHFSPPPLVWVQERGEEHFGVLIQPFAGARNLNIICPK